MTATELAADCGIMTAPAQLVKLSAAGSTFLVKRFDRSGSMRIHFASAMTMLSRKDYDTEGASYLDIADFLRMYETAPEKDLAELWHRIVFNMAISNTDDHLRNHGFLLQDMGWRLSPVFDINPVPGSGYLSLDVDGNDSELDFNTAIEASEYYGIDKDSAREYVDSLAEIIRYKWKHYARKNGISGSEIDYIQPAFRLAESWK